MVYHLCEVELVRSLDLSGLENSFEKFILKSPTRTTVLKSRGLMSSREHSRVSMEPTGVLGGL